jgi:putative transposase
MLRAHTDNHRPRTKLAGSVTMRLPGAQPAQRSDQVSLPERDAARGRAAGLLVQEDATAAAPDRSPVVVVDRSVPGSWRAGPTSMLPIVASAGYDPSAMRHTTFRFTLAPTLAQEALLARHAGASRFAYNQCLRLVADAHAAKRADPQVKVPWSGFDLINAFNAWKRSEAAGRIFVAAPDGTITKQVTGLGWRHEVSAQVFEEAAVDLGRALSAHAQAKKDTRKGRRAGFPRWKRKGRCRDSFRLRNKQDKGGAFSIRVGEGHPRCVTLPTIGAVRVHDDTRRLRRLLRPVTHLDLDSGQPEVTPRAKILFATVSRHGSRWYVSLNLQAPDVHPARRHPPRPTDDHGGFVGVDRGLAAFAVAATADRTEVGRFHAPKPLQRGMVGLRRRSRAVSRAQFRSRNRAKAARRLSRQHARIANVRRSFLHEVSSKLVQTHDRLCLEDLTVANLMTNRHLARAIGDAAWTELARQLTYKAAWLGAELVVCDRWYASTKTCSGCGMVKQQVGLVERSYCCDGCGLAIDRDRNAAANLAAWAERSHAQAPDRQAGGRATNAPGGEGAGHRRGDGATSPSEGGTDAHALLA